MPFGLPRSVSSSVTWSASPRGGASQSAARAGLPAGARSLAGGREHARGGGGLAGGDELDDRQCEGERLPRARRRLAEDVAPLERVGDDERLDTKRLDDAAGGERLLDLRAHAERAKRLGHTGSTPSIRIRDA